MKSISSADLVSALRTLARYIHADDGVANSCLTEAAARIEGLELRLHACRQDRDNATKKTKTSESKENDGR